MKSDIEIAREANMQPIQTVAEKLDITADELDGRPFPGYQSGTGFDGTPGLSEG